jgi:hypothetical protein
MTGSTTAATCVAAPTRPTSLRLTSDGRALILVVFLAVAVLLLSLGHGASSQAASTTDSGPATRVVVVEPGQSLWSIAASVAPNADPRETIQRITSLNGLTSSVLPVGKALIVPAPAA